jgi:hypothetical protein
MRETCSWEGRAFGLGLKPDVTWEPDGPQLGRRYSKCVDPNLDFTVILSIYAFVRFVSMSTWHAYLLYECSIAILSNGLTCAPLATANDGIVLYTPCSTAVLGNFACLRLVNFTENLTPACMTQTQRRSV